MNERLPRVVSIAGNHLQTKIGAAGCNPPPAYGRYNAGSKIVVVLAGLPAVVAGKSRTEKREGLRAARMMMPKR